MKNTKAPLLLFGFLGILVCCIVISIVIALKNPAIDDDSYFSSKKQVDYEINAILKEQRWFLKNCQIYLDFENEKNARLELLPPYFQTKTRDAVKIEKAKEYNLRLITQGQLPDQFQAHLYLERINYQQPRIDLGDFSQSDSKKLMIEHKGRYKTLLVVTYERNKEMKKIFFEGEIFAL
ncbi:hypothetical protein [Helicobacter kayseriensis]|uniref:hypothetical protein n=1 Tax=Helicobacter kayseriensis TaxID=2905877 RepID=UPI001E52CF7B|nr:hypothetical protein [Helicobacter kayseriensis]MCE3047059.1 hypothetical protein [Helicobacter kayseriensis]MCE3048281.1 hypothetical protein [Helicobacter kayseriensis]